MVTEEHIFNEFIKNDENIQENLLRYLLYYSDRYDIVFLDKLFQHNKLSLTKWERITILFVNHYFQHPIIVEISQSFFDYIYSVYEVKQIADIYLMLFYFEDKLNKIQFKELLNKLFAIYNIELIENNQWATAALNILKEHLGEQCVNSTIFLNSLGGQL